MLLENLNPLHSEFELDGLTVKLEDFDDDIINFIVTDSGGLQVGAFSVMFDSEGNNIEYSDANDPGTLDKLRKHHDNHNLAREIRKIVKSTL